MSSGANPFSPDGAAAALLGARRTPRVLRAPLSPLPSGSHPSERDEGIKAQLALAGLVGAARPAGFKIGATAVAMQRYLGLDGPAAGFMAGDGLHASGSTLSVAPFLNPGVECEIAVHLAHDLAPGSWTAEQAAGAVDLLMTAIEIVENRYADLKAFGTPALIADQVFHAAAILGTPVTDWRSLDLAAIEGEIRVDGQVMGRGAGRDLLGHPMQALAWLAGSDEVAAFGGLRAGQVIMLGSVTPPIWLVGPAVVEVQFDPFPVTTLNLV